MSIRQVAISLPLGVRCLGWRTSENAVKQKFAEKPLSAVRDLRRPLPSSKPDSLATRVHRGKARAIFALYTNLSVPDTLAESSVKSGMSK